MKICYFCTNNLPFVDYKDVETLKKFLDAHGRIAPAKRTNVCAKHSRALATAIKQARFMALLPFIVR